MTVINLKPPPAQDPNRKALCAAIALHAGARRDLRVADDAASLAAQRCWEAQSRLEELRKVVEPAGARAGAFIASVDAGNPCTTATLERSSVAAGAKMAAAENEFAAWDETRRECDQVAREKEAAVAPAKERVEKAARMVICNEDTIAHLVDELERLQADVIGQRSVLRFIGRQSCNGELAGQLRERLERTLCRDLMGLEPSSAQVPWVTAFERLLTDPEVELPS